MKIDLEDIEIGISPLTDEVFVGILDKKNPNLWKHKKSVTNGFLTCVISRWNGYKQTITSSDGQKYEISIKKMK